MTTLNINGKRVTVDDSFTSLSPEQQAATVEEIASSMAPPSVGEDVAKAGASGLARGAADFLGMAGSIGDAFNSAGQYGLRKGYELVTGAAPSPDGGAVEKFFAGPTDEVNQAMIGGGSNPMSGQNLKAGLSKLTGGATDYQPQTTAGEYARTVGEFAPAALAGPGGLVRKAVMASAPAVASETAGQVTEGTALEPWARAGAAIGTGMLSAGVRNPITQNVKSLAKDAPTREALKQQTDDLYNTMRQAGIRYDANMYTSTVQNMSDSLLKAGLRPSVAKEAFGLVDDLKVNIGQSPDFDDINGLVQMVGSAARSAERAGNGPLAKAYGIIRDRLDNFERFSPLVTTKNMPRQALDEIRSTARKTALKNIKARALDEIVENAQTYQGGVESGIRNQVGSLLRSKKGKQLFNGEERTALLQVSQGRKPLQTLSRFGFDLSSINGNASFLPALGALGAHATAGPLAGAGLALAGTAAKALSPRMTEAALEQTSGAIRGGGLNVGGKAATEQLRNQQIMRRLLSGQMGAQGMQTGG